MRPRVVVLLDVRGDEPPELRGRPVLAYPHALGLEAAEPSLHDHVVHPPGLAVHALQHVARGEKPLVGGRVEDRPLVGVEDRGRAVRGERLLDAGADARRAHVVGEPPSHDEAGIPADHAGEVHVGPPDRDVGDVYAPDLVGEAYGLVLQQVGVPERPLRGLGEARLRVDRPHVHLLHEPGDGVPGDVELAPRALPQLDAQLAGAGVGHLEVGLVDDAHGELALLALGGAPAPPGLVVVRRPGDMQQLELAGDRDLSVFRVYQGRPRCRCRSA